jgi:hypothetical protein
MNPNASWNGSLESYHPHLLPGKVSKNPKIYCIHSSLPKIQKSVLDFLGSSQVKKQSLYVIFLGGAITTCKSNLLVLFTSLMNNEWIKTFLVDLDLFCRGKFSKF